MPVDKNLLPFQDKLVEQEINSNNEMYSFKFFKADPHKLGKVFVTDIFENRTYETVYSLQLENNICKVRFNLKNLPYNYDGNDNSIKDGILVKPFEEFIDFLESF